LNVGVTSQRAGVGSVWNAFSAFQVFGDHVPMDGFTLVMRVSAEPQALERLLGARAREQDNLDPELALMMIRAGVGLATAPAVQFAYANLDEAVIVLRPDAVAEVGQSLEVHDHLISGWAARMALISGESVPVCGRIYELPDLGVVRKALRTAIDAFEEQTPMRSARWLGAQLRGRGQAFHLSMIETLEEQSHLLAHHGVDINALPSWWWRGVAARRSGDGVQVLAELPTSEELVGLI
jgi:hypothetical protein